MPTINDNPNNYIEHTSNDTGTHAVLFDVELQQNKWQVFNKNDSSPAKKAAKKTTTEE